MGWAGLRRAVLAHTRALVLEQLRSPVTVLGNLLFPVLGLVGLLLVLPDAGRGDAGAVAVAQFLVAGALTNGLFTTCLTVADDAGSPWGGYLRTLPASPLVRPLALAATVTLGTLISALAVLAAALVLLERPPAVAAAMGALAWLVPVAAGYAALGWGLGRILTLRAVLPVAQTVFLVVAFGGGLLLPPGLATRAPAALMPSTAGVEVLSGQLLDVPVRAGAVGCLLGWLVGFGVLAVALAWARVRRERGYWPRMWRDPRRKGDANRTEWPC